MSDRVKAEKDTKLKKKAHVGDVTVAEPISKTAHHWFDLPQDTSGIGMLWRKGTQRESLQQLIPPVPDVSNPPDDAAATGRTLYILLAKNHFFTRDVFERDLVEPRNSHMILQSWSDHSESDAEFE
jgi:hypothetical protein